MAAASGAAGAAASGAGCGLPRLNTLSAGFRRRRFHRGGRPSAQPGRPTVSLARACRMLSRAGAIVSRSSSRPRRCRGTRAAACSMPGSRTWQRPHMARPLRASAEPLHGCAGQPCALRTSPRLEFSTHMQYASTALFCDLGSRPSSSPSTASEAWQDAAR
eukprot:scaffold38240_cov63-Phaeocystis_antarctica.AAC.1